MQFFKIIILVSYSIIANVTQANYVAEIHGLLHSTHFEDSLADFRGISSRLKSQLIAEKPVIDLESAQTQTKNFYQTVLSGYPDYIEATEAIIDKGIYEQPKAEIIVDELFGDSSTNFIGKRSPYHNEEDSIQYLLLQQNDQISFESEEYVSWISEMQEKYLSDPRSILNDFRIKIDLQHFSLDTLIHETAHVLFYFNGAISFKSKRKGLNDNIESVSVYFETLNLNPYMKNIRLKQICDHFIEFMKTAKDEPDNKDVLSCHGNPVEFICYDDYITALYNAFKLSKKIELQELTVFEGMNEAMYGEIPPLTLDQLDELVDILAS